MLPVKILLHPMPRELEKIKLAINLAEDVIDEKDRYIGSWFQVNIDGQV